MPYTKSEFDVDKQDKFKQALGTVAQTTTLNIDIPSMTDARRSGKVDVQTQVRYARVFVRPMTNELSVEPEQTEAGGYAYAFLIGFMSRFGLCTANLCHRANFSLLDRSERRMPHV